MQRLEPAQLLGVNENQLQTIYDNALRQFKTRVFFLDASYLYTFHLDDFVEVKKFNLLGRYYAQELKRLNELIRKRIPVNKQYYNQIDISNSNYCRQWHINLETWYDNKYVTLGDRSLKPIKISRTLDRVVNSGMEMLADCVTGQGSTTFNFRALGDGVVTDISLADTDMYHTVDIIDVNNAPEGGSLSTDGTTIFSVGNHAKSTPTPVDEEFTECSMFDDDNEENRIMFDHSGFEDPIPHVQNADAPGSTTIVYMCSG